MVKDIWERKPEKMISTEARSWLAELQEEWNKLQEKAEKLEDIMKHFRKGPGYTASLKIADWFAELGKILEAEG